MLWKQVLGLAGAALLGFIVAGGLLTYAVQVPSSDYLTAIGITSVFLALLIVAGAALGSKSPSWLSNPYW